MKILRDENYVLNIIKFGPIFFVIIFSIFITKAFLYEKNINFEKEIKLLEKSYLDSNKKRVKDEIERIYREIKEEKEQSEKLLKEEIKSRVYEAHKIASNIYEELSKKNKETYSNENILKTIRSALGAIIYNKGRGYFFINNREGINLLQPLNKKIENTNILHLKDLNGYYFMKTINQSIKDKIERFDTYYWYKNSVDKIPYKKISFYKYFEPLDISIGTGEYIEDFESEIKEKLLERINKIIFDKIGYIFIFDLKGNALAHYNKNKIGINRINEKDLNGRYFIKDIIDFSRTNKKGFIPYLMKFKPFEEELSRKKISYVKLFEDWGWVIGTGFYLDNLNKQIEQRKLLLNNSKNESVKHIIVISLFVTLFFVLVSFYISRIITHRLVEYKKSVETQISENIEQKETLLEAQRVASIGSLKLNTDTNIIEHSEQILNIFGIINENIVLSSEYIKSILVHDDINKFEKFIKNCISNKKQNKEIFRINRLDDELRWLECRGKFEKNKNLIIGTIQDITDSKILEIEKQEKEELFYHQSKLALMGEMIGNIAHQWRQPLSVISSLSTGSKLQKEMNIFNDDDFNTIMDQINDSAQHLSQTIEDFRCFFDPKNTKLKEFSISEVVNKSLVLVSSQFVAKEISIINNISDYKITSLENELVQVLINILNNSRDALIPLQNQRKLIFINTYQKDKKSYLEIIDNAGGISQDIINRIFEPYFTTKHQYHGTGIGLYMSQSIVNNLLHGQIKVLNDNYTYENIKYKGAKFIIEIDI